MSMVYSLIMFPFVLFSISMLGMIINSASIILLLISIEVMLLSISLSFLTMSLWFSNIIGLMAVMFVITVAAVESAIGLSMMISFYKMKGSISISFLNLLKG